MPQLAFPWAEGFGKYSEGGRGGIVCEVNTIADNNTAPVFHPAAGGVEAYWEGSLRALLGQVTGARTIIFKVSGVIDMRKVSAGGSGLGPIYVNSPYVTIAAHTAPGDGVMLKGDGLYFTTKHIQVHHLRGFGGPDSVDPNSVRLLTFEVYAADQHCIVDHCTGAWYADDTMSMTMGGGTIQNCIGAENQNFGGLILGGLGGYASGRKVSVLNNFFTGSFWRNPACGEGQVDVVNNVSYNQSQWMVFQSFWNNGQANFVKNYFKHIDWEVKNEGQTARYKPFWVFGDEQSGIPNPDTPRQSTFYLDGNEDTDFGTTQSNLIQGFAPSTFNSGIDHPTLTGTRLAFGDTYTNEVSASAAVTRCFLAAGTGNPGEGGAGAYKTCNSAGVFVNTRPAYEQELFNEWNGTGIYWDGLGYKKDGSWFANLPHKVKPFPTAASGATAYTDTNHDGVPDSYTLPAGAVGSDLRSDGYSFLEGFLFELDRYWDSEPVNLPVNLGIQTYVLTNGVYTPLTGISVEAAGQNIDKVEFTVTGNNASLELSVTANADIDVVT